MTVVTVVTSISHKTDEYEGYKNFMVGNAAETTDDSAWPQNQSTQASVHMYLTDDHSGDTNPANMHQTSVTELSMLVSD